jgi:hypothetical protein
MKGEYMLDQIENSKSPLIGGHARNHGGYQLSNSGTSENLSHRQKNEENKLSSNQTNTTI